ncbi:MAG TPA: hypothetical protein VHG28_15775 [Longimicrobiaceae bacterium]|nr:hypothetical protein [Longimicrobiaceae bacterium]
MNAVDTVVAAVLAAWLLASAIAQLPGRWSTWIRRWDVVGLIPSFSFFAPNPASSDCHIVYRHVLVDGRVTGWTDAFVWRPVPWRLVWNPDRRAEKAISDATSALARRSDDAGVRLSVSYLVLLNYVVALPRSTDAVGVQFALIGAAEFSNRAPFARFVSDTHPLYEAVPLPDLEPLDSRAATHALRGAGAG